MPRPAVASRGSVVDAAWRLDVYARARLAEADGDLASASVAYAEALRLDPASQPVSRRSYRLAVMAGDRALALRAAHSLDAAGALPRDGTVLLLIEALDAGRWDRARLLTDRIEGEGNLAFLTPFLRSWIAQRSGGAAVGPVIPMDKPHAVFAQRYRVEQELLLALARDDRAGAVEAYAQAARSGTGLGAQERTLLAGQFDRLGERGIALALLAADANDDGAAAEAALARVRKLRRAGDLSPQYGLSVLLTRLAVDLFAQDEVLPTFSIARMASFAAPGNDDARVTVARAALNADYAAEAYAEASMVPPASPAWFDAQIGQVRALVDQGQATEAAARAEALVRQDGGSARAWRLLGDVRVRRDDFAGAAEAYGQARKALGDREDPSLLLQLGGALEQAGDWAAARPLLVRVVELAPDSAAALNHLGYALADRGETLPQAIALLEKANRIRPNVPAYVDSLGWAFFRSGQYARALPLIESAAADDPANGELSEHLGDVLWAMGRRFEARYAWKAALAGLDGGDGPAALRARLTRKLDGGAPVAGAR